MTETAFNLVDEPWIRVMTPDCRVSEVSLMAALVNAHEYQGLAGEMEAQNVAVLRLLIAVAHTIFTRVNLDGEQDPVEDEKTAMDRWAALMRNGKLPPDPIRDYLQTWYERFWLFHPERPFYQANSAENGTECIASKLNGEVSESNNKLRLFSLLTGDGRQSMTFSESARWLLFINGFDDCAAKQKDKRAGSRSMTIGWLGKLGLVTAVGQNLFETILLNMTMLNGNGEIWKNDDQPTWELDEAPQQERRPIPMPDDFASLLTLQSRRIMLKMGEGRVVGYSILGGDSFPEQGAFNEPMTLWRYTEDKKTKFSGFIPRRHDRARQIWRDFGALVNTGEYQEAGKESEQRERRPGVVSWVKLLRVKKLLPLDRPLITFRVCCVRYDSSQSSSITDAFSDALSFHANLLLDAGKMWIREVERQLGLIEQAAGQVGNLAVALGKAVGQREVDLKSAANTAKEQFYLSIDLPFRNWLLRLDPDQDSDDRIKWISEWMQLVRQTALSLGRQLVDEKGDVAFVGRMVQEDKKKERHYSAPEAYRWFKYHLGKIYPFVKEGE